MKKFKLLLAICVASLSLCFVGPKQDITSTDAASVSKPTIVEWDTENKLIYANLNSLLIVADNGGTTVYLDLPEDAVNTGDYQTGDGVLNSHDKSLAEIYAANSTEYDSPAPENGADLSAWSIIIGGNNVNGNILSTKKTVITMTGGEIYNIYNGCSTFQAECDSTIAGESVEVNITGGSVNEINTDFGYIGEFGGDANGSNRIEFNLFGGTIQTIRRGEGSKLVYGSKINLGASVKIVQGIQMAKYSKGSMIYLKSALEENASLTFDVGSYDGKSFAKSNELLTVDVADVAILETLDLSKITLANVPEAATDWVLYKNQNTVKYGHDVKVESVEISGLFKVGETLRLNYAPANATFKSISWYTINPVTNERTILSSGLTYKLASSEGGEYIYIKAVDQNDAENIFEIRSSSVVQRVEIPEIVVKDSLISIYANGNDLLIVGGEKGTTIYVDLGTIGVLDNRDMSLKEAGVKNAYENDSDLSYITVCAGCANDENTGNVNITVLGGHIKEIVSRSTNNKKINGYVNINLKGGKVGLVAANASAVNGAVRVNISEDAVAKIYSKASSLGGAEIRLIGVLSEKSDITIVEDNPILNGNICVETDNEEFIDVSKFKFETPYGKKIVGLKAKKGFLDGRHTIDYNVEKVEAIRIAGKVKVGSTLTVETNPLNSYISVKWYRSSTDSFYFAKLIEGADTANYTLTAEDEGMYIFVEVVDGYGYDFDAMTSKVVAPENLPKSTVAVLVIAIVVAVLIIAFVVWFILWKKLIVGGWIMTKAFERIDKAFFKSKTEDTKTESKANKALNKVYDKIDKNETKKESKKNKSAESKETEKTTNSNKEKKDN